MFLNFLKLCWILISCCITHAKVKFYWDSIVWGWLAGNKFVKNWGLQKYFDFQIKRFVFRTISFILWMYSVSRKFRFYWRTNKTSMNSFSFEVLKYLSREFRIMSALKMFSSSSWRGDLHFADRLSKNFVKCRKF